jgi:hypothetical protein
LSPKMKTKLPFANIHPMKGIGGGFRQPIGPSTGGETLSQTSVILRIPVG